jgi:hypothetical protein
MRFRSQRPDADFGDNRRGTNPELIIQVDLGIDVIYAF